MGVYRPKFMQQWNDPTTTLDWVNCTMSSGAMGLDFDTLGHVQKTGGQLRAVSGDTQGGTSLQTLDRSWNHYGQDLYIQTGNHWDDVVTALKEYRGVVLQGMYGAIPAKYQSPLNSFSFIGPHSVYLNPEFNSDGDILMGDPLNDKYIWVPRLVLMRFAEALGAKELGARTNQPIFFANSDPHKPVPVDPIPYVHTVEVTAVTLNIREQPRANSKDVGDLKRGARIKTTLLRKKGGEYIVTGSGNNAKRTDWLGFTHNGETDWIARGYTKVIS